MKNVKQWMLASRIEWNWLLIGHSRRHMSALIERGERYTSPRLVRIDAKTARRSLLVKEMERRYRATN